jgi:hypothetical protein
MSDIKPVKYGGSQHNLTAVNPQWIEALEDELADLKCEKAAHWPEVTIAYADCKQQLAEAKAREQAVVEASRAECWVDELEGSTLQKAIDALTPTSTEEPTLSRVECDGVGDNDGFFELTTTEEQSDE